MKQRVNLILFYQIESNLKFHFFQNNKNKFIYLVIIKIIFELKFNFLMKGIFELAYLAYLNDDLK